MRTVIIANPSTPPDTLYALKAAQEPQEGEAVELITSMKRVIGRGTITNVRPDKDWPGRWLYDVVVIL